MKNVFIQLSLIILPVLSFAQFDYSFDLISSMDYTFVNNSFTSNSTNVSVKPKYNYRFGGNFNVKVYDNIYIKTGLRFAQVGFTNKREELRWPGEFGPNGFKPDPSLPRYLHSTIDQSYFEIPIIFRYEFDGKKLSFYLETGISPHIYSRTRYITKSNIDTTKRFSYDTQFGGKRLLMCYVFGIGLNYNFDNLYQFFFQPTIRIYVSNDNQFQFENAFRSIGIELGFRRGFSFEKVNKS